MLEVFIPPPYHINSASPLEAYLIPTTVEFEKAGGVEFGKTVFPDARLKRMRFSDNPLAVYEGTIRIVTPLALPPDFRGGEISVKGRLGYQACDDQSCLAPAEAAFSGTYAVVSAGEKAETARAVAKSRRKPGGSAPSRRPKRNRIGIRRGQPRRPGTTPLPRGRAGSRRTPGNPG